MAADDQAYARFRAALQARDVAQVMAAARELPSIGLHDALRICVVLGDGDRERFDRAAVRWLGRLARDVPGVTVSDMQIAADLLDVLPEDPEEAYGQLQELLAARGVND